VLNRDPICVLCELRQSTVADHYPLSRKELLEQGMNPNDPNRGRGLCVTCHNRETAVNQPGGWNVT
jgi:5-methylcytosine-specific restriction protein A